MHDKIVILDFGAQYSLLIARRVRECGVYCELLPHDAPLEKVAELNPMRLTTRCGAAPRKAKSVAVPRVAIST